MSRLLTKTDVATMLHVGRDAAAALLDSWGVPTINLGPGRGRGRRWDALDVERAIQSRKVQLGATTAKQPGRPKKMAEKPMTYKESLAYFSGVQAKHRGRNRLTEDRRPS